MNYFMTGDNPPEPRSRVKIFAMTNDGEETELGPFNQGLVIDVAGDRELMSPMSLRDVATGKAVARFHQGLWFMEGVEHARINQLFIQAV